MQRYTQTEISNEFSKALTTLWSELNKFVNSTDFLTITYHDPLEVIVKKRLRRPIKNDGFEMKPINFELGFKESAGSMKFVKVIFSIPFSYYFDKGLRFRIEGHMEIVSKNVPDHVKQLLIILNRSDTVKPIISPNYFSTQSDIQQLNKLITDIFGEIDTEVTNNWTGVNLEKIILSDSRITSKFILASNDGFECPLTDKLATILTKDALDEIF